MQPQNDTNVKFSDRLVDLIEKCPHKQKDISLQTGISESALANYKKDRIPKSDELYKLASFFGVSMEWLLTGRELSSAESTVLASNLYYDKENPGDIDPAKVAAIEKYNASVDEAGNIDIAKFLALEKRIEEASSSHPVVQNGGRMVPVIGMAHAGVACDYDEIDKSSAELVPTMCTDPKAFALDIEGDSMFPLVADRDNVVVMPGKEPHNGCVVVARLKEGGVLCRKVERVGMMIRLIPVNKEYMASDHTPDDFYWIYPVWGTWKQFWR